MFRKILIANRGEIACRILRTCKRLGIAGVAVYSEADARAQHVRLASEAWLLGGPRPAESYLCGERIIEIARQTGAEAIHPGFGFLSENAEFAEAVEAAGIKFIGPAAASMRKLGSKAGAKLLMEQAGVPVVPGYTGSDQDPLLLRQEAERIGFPLMIKAAHGGGGKGMRVVRALSEFDQALASCQREAANAFGRDRVLLERYIEHPRHIEFQIFGDAHGHLIHLNERECSVQRRYQKIYEETPSPFVHAELRTRMGAAAVASGRAIDYVNAGTVEFIVAPDGAFFFMEINTRLQVEHPVTEATLGVDLVEWQLKVAAGEALPWTQEQVRAHGHAIEVRLYAEDPHAGFLPSSGTLSTLRLPPAGPHVRIDSGVVEGDAVTVYYDPMIAKLIVHDRDRPAALERLREALMQTEIAGIKSNINFLESLIAHPRLRAGTFDTGYLDRALDEVLEPETTPPTEVLLGATVASLLRGEQHSQALARAGEDPHSPWSHGDGWRLGHPGRRLLDFNVAGQAAVEVSAQGAQGNYDLTLAGQRHAAHGARLDGPRLSFLSAGRAVNLLVHPLGDSWQVHDGRRRYTLKPVDHFAALASTGAAGNLVRAPMPGRVVALKTAVGHTVEAGQELLVMEAMKMELSLKAPRAGSIAEVRAQVGDAVEADAVLVRLDD